MPRRGFRLWCATLVAMVAALLLTSAAHVGLAGAESDCIVWDCARCSEITPLICVLCEDGFRVTSDGVCEAVPDEPSTPPGSTTTTTTTTLTPAGCFVEGCAECNTRNPHNCKRCGAGYLMTPDFQCHEAAGDSTSLPMNVIAGAVLAVCVALQLTM
jgi:hypothetical protein